MHKLLAHPLVRGKSPDDPETTVLRQRIIRSKGLLSALYQEWYERLVAAVPPKAVCPGEVLEIGAGGGFLRELMPECISSEIFVVPGLDLVLDAQAMPFADDSLRGIVMVDVLHHIPDVGLFFSEVERVLRPGGVVAMLEPWNTAWSRLIYKYLHSEPFEPDVISWSFPSSGPLSGANGALPWILFERDHNIFKQRFLELRLKGITLDYPICYLLSGGVSLRSFAPGMVFRPLRLFESGLKPFMKYFAMFSLIILERMAPDE